MTVFSEFHDSVPWSVVLPDCVAGERVAARLDPYATNCVRHVSGRPWLMGRWEADELALAEVGSTRLAVLGDHDATSVRLSALAGGASDVVGLDWLAGRFNGAFLLLASVDGVVRVQGSALGLRRVLHTRVDGVSVAGDRADVLAALSGSDLDERRLALRLLVGMALPAPLTGTPVWQGVDLVPPGHCLIVNRDGGARQRQWWKLPSPVLSRSTGASQVRKAMEEAMAFRVARGGVLTAELGGVDSTSVCSVATRAGAHVIAYTAASPDPASDDVAWARRTSTALGIDHHVIPHEELPLMLADLLKVSDRFDAPGIGTTDVGAFLVVQKRAAGHGATAHVGGYGGDELFLGIPMYLHGLVTRRPLTALRHIRGFRAMYRWPASATLWALADRRGYRTWLRNAADGLTARSIPLDPELRPSFGWMTHTPHLLPWASDDAVAVVREQLRAAAETAEPLAPDRGLHFDLQALRFATEYVRQLDQISRRLGNRFTAVYAEDKVAAAALSVRSEERVSPWQYKPLLAEAMRGVVPEVSRVRGTKAHGSVVADRGARRHRDNLLAACEDSRLGRLGLVDLAALRQACSRPAQTNGHTQVLAWNLSVEMWLRSLERTHENSPSGRR
jgi:asparagine synthase (glutamine-hydrolysing)